MLCGQFVSAPLQLSLIHILHIRTLRKKLGDAGKYICTVRKVGYKLADSEEEPEE